MRKNYPDLSFSRLTLNSNNDLAEYFCLSQPSPDLWDINDLLNVTNVVAVRTTAVVLFYSSLSDPNHLSKATLSFSYLGCELEILISALDKRQQGCWTELPFGWDTFAIAVESRRWPNQIRVPPANESNSFASCSCYCCCRRCVWLLLNGAHLALCSVFASCFQPTRLSSREQWLNLCEKTNHKTSIQTRSMQSWDTNNRHKSTWDIRNSTVYPRMLPRQNQVNRACWLADWPSNWVAIDKTQLGCRKFWGCAKIFGQISGPQIHD